MTKSILPAERCLIELYDGDRQRFGDDLDAYLRTSYVISTPQVFLMCRPVCSWWTFQQMALVDYQPDNDNPDTWLVWQLTGDLQIAITSMPFPLTWIVAGRKNKVKFYKVSDLCRLTGLRNERTTRRNNVCNNGGICP